MGDIQEKVPEPPEQDLELTDEQLEEIREKGQRLVNKDPAIQGTCVTLLFAQQLYHCGLAALRHYLQDTGKGDDQVEAYLIRSMREASMRPFSRHDLLKKTHAMILPWLLAEIEAEQRREEAANLAEEATYEKTRRSEGFPLPWPVYDSEPENQELPRDRSLVLVGHAKASELLLQHVINKARSEQIAGKRLVVCRLLATDKPSQAMAKSELGKRDYFEIGRSQWAGKLTSIKKIGALLNPWMKFSKRHRIDMLVVDDLAAAMPLRNDQVPLAYHLNETNKLLRRWCDRAGSFLIAAAPTGESHEPPERSDEWNMLDVFSTLRMIEVVPGPIMEDRPTYQLCWKDGTKLIVAEPNVPRESIDV